MGFIVTQAGFHMIRVLIVLTAALGASGCLLDETECGSDWTRVNGVCVPDKNAGGFYGGRPSQNVESQSPVRNDASASFENVSSKPDGALSVDAEPMSSDVDRWAEYSVVLTVDQSTPNVSVQVNVTAGIDLDAVLIIAPDDQVIGLAERVVEGMINPSRTATDPPQELSVTLGEPDGRAISMGVMALLFGTKCLWNEGFEPVISFALSISRMENSGMKLPKCIYANEAV